MDLLVAERLLVIFPTTQNMWPATVSGGCIGQLQLLEVVDVQLYEGTLRVPVYYNQYNTHTEWEGGLFSKTSLSLKI